MHAARNGAEGAQTSAKSTQATTGSAQETASPGAAHERVLINDFGSQVTQLIARRVRESGVYCEIHPYNKAADALAAGFNPKAVILSGGPASVLEGESPRAPQDVFTLGVPVLAICYG